MKAKPIRHPTLKKGTIFLIKDIKRGISKTGMPYTRIVTDTNPWVVIFMTGDWDWNEGDTFQINEIIGGQVKHYKGGAGWCTQVSFSCVCELAEKNYKQNHQEEYLWESDTEEYLWNV